ncbi:MAG: hypothetical protein KIT09_11835 [Bryobacteraceae bacterium]|nr:hypothetical protein [Bryobacteraceae bacterium]
MEWPHWADDTRWFWLPFADPARTKLDLPAPCEMGRGPNQPSAVRRFFRTAEAGLSRSDEHAAANEIYYRRRLLERRDKSLVPGFWDKFIWGGALGYLVRPSHPFTLLFLAWLAASLALGLRKTERDVAATRELKLTTFPVERATKAPLKRLSWRACLASLVLISKINLGTKYKIKGDFLFYLLLIVWLVTWVLVLALLVSVASAFSDLGRLLGPIL